jgi:hypothetical protein
MTKKLLLDKFYGNCKVLSPNGLLMFRCDEKRIKWYLNRDLAQLVDNNTIKLKFEPRGLGNHGKEFGLEPMNNICVNCGTDENLTKHHIIPISYRRHFPLELKSRNFHDVLLMCLDCHHNYEKKALELKIELSDKYNVPFNFKQNEFQEKIKKSIYYSKMILYDSDKLPKYRKIELYNFFIQNFGENSLNYLEKFSILNSNDYKSENNHFKLLVSKIDNLQDFIEMWRKHFIENNEVKYLPKSWNIKNKIKTND